MSLCRTLSRRRLSTNSHSKEFFRTLFKHHCLAFKKDMVPMIFNFPMESCKPTIGQTNNGKNNPLRTTGQLLSHFPGKRFAFRSKTFPTNDLLMPKCSNVQDNNDVTKESFSQIPSIKLHSHFGNIIVKPSAIFILLTFLLFFTAQEKKFCISYLLNVLKFCCFNQNG